jgi:hypothetical protein
VRYRGALGHVCNHSTESLRGFSVAEKYTTHMAEPSGGIILFKGKHALILTTNLARYYIFH